MIDISFCEEFSKNFDLALDCCDLCHDDFEMGYADLCEKEIDGVTYLICCRMSQRYDEKYGKG